MSAASQYLEQGRLVQGHRVSCPSVRTLVGLADRHTVAPFTAVTHAVRTEDLNHVLGHDCAPSGDTDSGRTRSVRTATTALR